jgi:hypothetical protein
MPLLAPRDASPSQLFDASLELAKGHFLTMIRVALPALFVSAVIELVSQVLRNVPLMPPIAFVVLLMAWGLTEAMAVAACWHILHGRAATRSNCWPLVSRRITAIVLGYCFKWLLIMAGFVLFIAPGVYLIALYFAVPTANLAENSSLTGAFRRSRQLERPGMKRLAVTLGSLELAGIALSVLVSAVLGDFGSESASLLGTIAAWALGVSLLPFRAALMTLLYVDRRVSREAYDLEVGLVRAGGAA